MPGLPTPEEAYDAVKGNLQKQLQSNSSMAIYGIGNAAFQVFRRLQDSYQIQGFLDKDPDSVGQKLFGGAVIPLEKAKNLDAIVIAANPVYWDAIAGRLYDFAQQNRIRLFYTDGTPCRTPERRQTREHAYWDADYRQLKARCMAFDVVSFDVFDTLLMRKAGRPEDVFSLVEKQIPPSYGCEGKFVFARGRAEQQCRGQWGSALYALADIYRALRALLPLTAGQAEQVMAQELRTEALLLTSRDVMRRLFSELQSAGKRILLVSDMYLQTGQLAPLLQQNGFTGYEKLFISCEQGASKQEGGLWRLVCTYTEGAAVLHIGDNPKSDIEQSQKSGASTGYVMSAADMLRESTFANLEQKAVSTGDSIALGMLQNRLMNDPFSMLHSHGRPCAKTPEDFGYLFFGPLVSAFFRWLLWQVGQDQPEVLWFIARDGLFFQRLYEQIRQKQPHLPPGAYLPASRRLCGVASFRTKGDVLRSLRHVYTGRADLFFQMRMGISPPLADPGRIVQSTSPETKALVEEHMDNILYNARVERERYLRYLEPYGEKQKIALFDLGENGSIQQALQNICVQNLQGYYLYYNDKKNNPYAQKNKARGFFQKSSDPEFSYIRSQTALLESVFTAPEGMYLFAKEGGGFVCDEASANAGRFERIQRIHDGVESFVQEYAALSANQPIQKEFTSAALSMVGKATIEKGIREALRFEDSFRGKRQSDTVL